MTDESNIGVWAWIGLIILINVYWIGWDLWLPRHGHEFLTTEFKEGLKNPLYGALIAFTLGGTVFAFLWHMYNTRDGG
jgi:hypothetical protein